MLVLAAAFAQPSRASEVDVRAQLQSLAGRGVFFGHQSVGMNLIEGLRELSVEQGVPLRVTEAKTPLEVPAGTFADKCSGETIAPKRTEMVRSSRRILIQIVNCRNRIQNSGTHANYLSDSLLPGRASRHRVTVRRI